MTNDDQARPVGASTGKIRNKRKIGFGSKHLCHGTWPFKDQAGMDVLAGRILPYVGSEFKKKTTSISSTVLVQRNQTTTNTKPTTKRHAKRKKTLKKMHFLKPGPKGPTVHRSVPPQFHWAPAAVRLFHGHLHHGWGRVAEIVDGWFDSSPKSSKTLLVLVSFLVSVCVFVAAVFWFCSAIFCSFLWVIFTEALVTPVVFVGRRNAKEGLAGWAF